MRDRGWAASDARYPTRPPLRLCVNFSLATCSGTSEPTLGKRPVRSPLTEDENSGRAHRCWAMPGSHSPGAGREPPLPRLAPPPLTRGRHSGYAGPPCQSTRPRNPARRKAWRPNQGPRRAVRHGPKTARRGQSAGAKTRPR